MIDRKQHNRQMRRMHRDIFSSLDAIHQDNLTIESCGKVGYESKEDAYGTAVIRLKSRTADQNYLRAYECPRCGYFHLTHKERL